MGTVVGPTPHPRNIGLISAIGLLVVLIVVGGAGYVLALNGTNVPLLYTMASGLSGDAKTAAASAATATKGQKSYTFASEISLSPLTDKDKPLLPSSTQAADNPVYMLKGVAQDAQYANGVLTSLTQVAVNDGTAIPLAVQVPAQGSWYLMFPSSLDTSVAKLDPTDLKQTVLYSIVKPMPLDLALSAVQKTTSLQKRSSSGKTVTAYAVTIDPASFKDYFPNGASLTGFTGVMELSWKGGKQVVGQPVAALITGTVAYRQRSYQFKEIWNITGWNTALSDRTEIKTLTDATQQTSAQDSTLLQAITQLGIGKLGQLPNSLDQTDTGTQVTSTAVTPTGEAIDKPGDTIAANPPVPTQPAADVAKTRDTQRKQDLATLKAALEKYKTDNGQYPTSSGLEQTISSQTLFNALVPKYLTKMPVDPLPKTYWYEYQSTGTSFTLRSVLENHSDKDAKAGGIYHYYEVAN